jgi:hypothetical protein
MTLLYHHYMPDHLQNNAPVGILLLFIYTPHLATFSQAPVCRSVESRSGPEYILLLIKEVVLSLSSSILFQQYIYIIYTMTDQLPPISVGLMGTVSLRSCRQVLGLMIG